MRGKVAMGWVWLSLIVALIFLVLYAFNLITAYWLGMFAVIFIVLGIVITFMLAGAGATATGGANKIGAILLVVGIILALIIFFVPK
ncbi:MAG: hypothetical protein GTN76_16135 [Candidatus Aenigmarchaeota archaeon]|nr:hypothetical protein [Candidatus Aenigmarchaeota archaeon]